MQPVRKDLFCDLAIIGGGVGGCTAAICAARRGLHVIMFEKGVSLGGLPTNGYVPQIAGGIEGICMEFTTPPAWTLKWTVQTSSAHSSIPRAA